MKKRIVVGIAVAMVSAGGLIGGSAQAKAPASTPGANVWNWGRCGFGGVTPGTMWGPLASTPNGTNHAPYLEDKQVPFSWGWACQS